jgi:diaminopimelate decarboxylase
VIELFPDSAHLRDGELALGGVGATELAERFGTPLVVLCEETLRARTRAFRAAVPDAAFYFGTKALPNVAVLRVLAEEGLGADVSTLGELAFARAAGLDGERLLVHGNNKSDEELAAAAATGATVALDAAGEAARAAAAGVRRVIVRVTPGVEAETHASIRTGHHGSKFGLPPDLAVAAVAEARAVGLEVVGLHVHVGSQLVSATAHEAAAPLLAAVAARCRDELGWTPALMDAGGGFAVRHVREEPDVDVAAILERVAAAFREAWRLHDLPEPGLAFEPGRALVGPAGVTLYRVGAVKQAAAGLPWAAVDGGMSDNPRPQLYGARYTALAAGRAKEEPTTDYAIAGKHCESGDVLIHDADLADPRPGDVIVTPATGAYGYSMANTYNGVPRAPVVFVRDGDARVVVRRETYDDLTARDV